ncbi:hypothetical protein ACGFIF_23915 [Kribbella sp. NPDC049174]|uniref:hypothetical protein n=1 Tax=Kribbella sp. NPDC049174 TaxID=3364112 RepID=UPI00372453E9
MKRPTPQAMKLRADADGQWVRRWTGDDWFAEADGWVRAQLAAAGTAVSAAPVPYKIRFWAAVWCYPTDHGLFWFKENNPGQAFEAALVGAMAQALPQHVVAPLAIDPERGWFLTADQGPTLGDQEGTDWRRLVIEYAGLQRDTVPVGDALLGSGLTSLAPSHLSGALHHVAGWFTGLSDDHPVRPGPETLAGVRRAADAVSEVERLLPGVVPMALDQNDLHARNVFRPDPAGPFRFFDFGDAVWGHPFATLASVREDVDEAVVTAYLEEWSDLAPLDVLRKELEIAEPLHVVHRMVSWHRLLEHADEIECAAWVEHIEHWLRELVRAYGSALA